MTGMSLLVPGVTWLILTTGWRTTYLFIAAGILVLVLPLCLLVLRDSPESVGLLADGATPRVGTSPDSIERVTAGEALRTLAFWQLAGSFFTCGFSMSLLSAHGIPMLTDHGYSPMFASWALGVLGCPIASGAGPSSPRSTPDGSSSSPASFSFAKIRWRSSRWPCSAASRWRARAR
jgi:hypothetical protein